MTEKNESIKSKPERRTFTRNKAIRLVKMQLANMGDDPFKQKWHYGRMELAGLLSAIYQDEPPVTVAQLQDMEYKQQKREERKRVVWTQRWQSSVNEGIERAKQNIAKCKARIGLP